MKALSIDSDVDSLEGEDQLCISDQPEELKLTHKRNHTTSGPRVVLPFWFVG